MERWSGPAARRATRHQARP
uniref:Uncharacterized protein n=1 Tax=Arundo donax TaxID=35708 RepID=A0A0A9EUG9_ARUDO